LSIPGLDKIELFAIARRITGDNNIHAVAAIFLTPMEG
jgi:hypothetical protein